MFDLPVIVLVVSVMGAGDFEAEVNQRLEEGWGPAKYQSLQVSCPADRGLIKEGRCRYTLMMARLKED